MRTSKYLEVGNMVGTIIGLLLMFIVALAGGFSSVEEEVFKDG
jgi:hypothetical protein